MDIRKIEFPLYKLRSYLRIDTNPLGLVKITTFRGVYIFDDTNIAGTFEERRMKLPIHYPGKPIYKLKERVIYLRQLVKYKSGTTFVDLNGNLVKYNKSSKLFEVRSLKISRRREYGNWTIIQVEGVEQPYLVGQTVLPTTTHASIMDTTWGPFLYDLTNKQHDTYRRKI
jgi:hypothetical protein